MKTFVRFCLCAVVFFSMLGASVRVIHAQGSASSQLAATMKLIQDKMNAQGPLHYDVYRHVVSSDPNGPVSAEKLNYKVDLSQNDFRANPTSCKVSFHDKQTTDFLGSISNADNEGDQLIALKSSNRSIMTPEMVSVFDGNHQSILRGKMQRLPNILYRVAPLFYIVEVRIDQSVFYELDLHTEDDAKTVSQALQHAILLCNHLDKEVF